MNDMEQRLRDAFSAKAEQVGHQSLHGGLPDLMAVATEPAGRRAWPRRARAVAPFLAAAAVVAVVGAAFVVGRSTQADRRPAAEQTEPPPPATVTVTVTPSATSSATQSASSTPSVGSTPTAQPAALAQGVYAAIPSGWTAVPGPKEDSPFGTQCWGPAGRCELAVYRADNELLWGKPLTNQECTSVPVQSYGMVRIDGQDVEHIVYGAACGQPASEQWTVTTRPQVYLQHPLGADDALVEDAVMHADLPGAYGPLPGVDYGFVESVAKGTGNTYTVTVARAIARDGQWDRWSPAVTYSFPYSSDMPGFFCYSWRIPGHQKSDECTVADLYLQGAKGPDPADGSRPLGSVPVLIQGNGAKVTFLDYIDSTECACPK